MKFTVSDFQMSCRELTTWQGTQIEAVAIAARPHTLWDYFDGLVQDCSNSSALAMELLQFCTKLLIYSLRPGSVSLNLARFRNVFSW